MKHYRIEVTQNFAGFDTTGVAKLNDLTEVEIMLSSQLEEEMYEYVSGYMDEEEDGEFGISVCFEEITEKEYSEIYMKESVTKHDNGDIVSIYFG